jgi:hypothetical protein
MKHIYLDHGKDCPNPGDCMFCDGGLLLCTVCGLAEGSLTTHCCGYKVDYETSQRVYGDELDFIDGKWVNI